MDNNGIIQIKDIHGLKTKYKIVNCLTIVKTNKDYLIYTKSNDSDKNILLCVSEIIQNNKNIIELEKVSSENTLIHIKNILINIINKKYDNQIFTLKNINIKLNFLLKGQRCLEIPNKFYKILKKDYNANKDNREIVGFYKQHREYIIENAKMADDSFVKEFTNSDNYKNIIKNI